jgi:phage major head subunit gpT-like protein
VKIKPIDQLRREALDALGAGCVPASVLELRATPGGAKLTQAEADELLRAAVARERVSLVMSVLAYEQGRRDAKGNVVKNRKGIRVRDGAVQSMGRSGKGTPWMRDHEQRNSLAKGGTVLDSRAVKLTEDGHVQILQEVELTEPTAVERALRGLMSSVSIGLEPLGPVTCTACKAEIFSVCFHWPFDVVEMKDGTKHEVEWEYSEAGLRETSEVPIPAVHHASVQTIRGSLAAQLSGAGIPLGASNPGRAPEETNVMDPELLKLLGLTATATPAEILAAVTRLQAAIAADKAELTIANTTLEAFKADIAALKAGERMRRETEFVTGALSTGRIGKGDEEHWRALFGSNETRAVELMAKREPNAVTPVGAPRQTPAVDPKLAALPVITGGAARRSFDPLIGRGGLERLNAQLAADPRLLAFADKFGFDVGDAGNLSGATTIANAADHAAAKIGFHAAFLQSLNAGDDPASILFASVTSTRASEEHHFMGDLPAFEEWTDDRKLAILKAFKIALANKKWSNGIRVKNDDFKDDNLGLLPSQVSGLASEARLHRFDLMIKLLLNGFDGTAYPEVGDGLAYDGSFFFDNDHLGGNNNVGSAALDATSLAAVGLKLEQMVKFNGVDPLNVYGTHLIVGPKNRTVAEKLLQQERLANGEDNINRGKYKLIVSPRIRGDYDDYWFLADLSKAIKPVLLQMREEISTMETGPNGMPAFQNDESWFGAQARYNVGYFEPRLIVGSAV